MRGTSGGPVDSSPAAVQSPSPIVSGSPSPTASGSASPDGSCPDTDIKVATTTSQPSYAAGVNPEITMTITNAGTLSRQRDVGSAANEILISSGGVRCGHPMTAAVVRPRCRHSAPRREGDGDTRVGPNRQRPDLFGVRGGPAGAYDAVGRNGKVRGAKTAFTLQ